MTSQAGHRTRRRSDAEVSEAGQVSYPWESDERFKGKTPEDIWSNYQEAQKAIGQASQKAELANLLEKHTGMNAGQIKTFLQQKEQQQIQDQVKANPGLAAFQEVQTLKSQLALQAEEKELDSFLNSEEGKPYAPFRDKIFNIGLNLEQNKSYSDIAKEWFGAPRAQGQQDAYQKIEVKKSTQATGTASTPQKKFTVDDMKNMSAAEMRTFLPRANR